MTIDRYAVAGNPVAHSQSPFIHAQFAAQTGQRLSYECLLCPLDGFEASLRTFAASGARGCNITVPFKFKAQALAQALSPRARRAGAVNTLRFDADGSWFGDNTDGAGLVRDIARNAGRRLSGTRVLLLGAGGAAAGALGALIAARPAEVVIANRSIDKAQALLDTHQGWAAQHGVRLAAHRLSDCGRAYPVLINATSASLGGAGVPVGPEVLATGALALDMMYGPAAAPFLAWARGHGAVARDGLGMLVEQAAEAFEVWRGIPPETAPVLAALREQLASR